MEEDPLSQHIERLVAAAQPGSSGVFSLDLARVEIAFQAGGDDWLHYLLRFAAFYGAEPAEIDWDGRSFELRFRSPGPDLEQLRSLLLHRERGPRYLALGMLAAAQQGCVEISLEAPRGRLRLHGSTSQLEENRRSRDGFCRLKAQRRGPLLPPLDNLVLPVFLNGTPQPRSPSGPGLRLLVDGFAMAWDGVPLLPPGESLDWPVAEVRLDARLRRLLQPALSEEQIHRLQSYFEAQLLERETIGPEAGEWLLLRAREQEVASLLARLPEPPAGHALAPAYWERRAAWLDEPLPAGVWEKWPADCWPDLLEQGLVPFPLAAWLRPTCARLPARPTYAYLLRRSWRGEHFEPAFLQALLQGRRDTLGGNVLLAGQLSQLKAAQRPAQATQFCAEFLRAATRGQEEVEEWSWLSVAEREQVVRLLDSL
ncbi:MAG: hypothetical protein KF760_15180 [Candidatus Eremiobacteraeota bacterium]|nr:hypothetical protein [Candidatus Eremiobacteraeota bacterium]MCW5866380.1 hypothetical protein [Candidatus Eremiobacteraeota bacterium]